MVLINFYTNIEFLESKSSMLLISVQRTYSEKLLNETRYKSVSCSKKISDNYHSPGCILLGKLSTILRKRNKFEPTEINLW